MSLTTNTYTSGFDINYEDSTSIREEDEYLLFEENIKSDLCSSTRKVVNPVKSKSNRRTTTSTLLEKILKKTSGRKQEKLETNNVLNSTYTTSEGKTHQQEFTKRINKKKQEKLVQHEPKVDGFGNSTFKIQENTTFVSYNNNQIESNTKNERFPNSKSKQNKDESASKELKFSLTAEEIRDRCRISIVCRNNTIAFEGHTF